MEKNYNIVKTADMLGLKIRTVREWIHNGKINGFKYNGSNRWMVSQSEIDRIRHKVKNENEN